MKEGHGDKVTYEVPDKSTVWKRERKVGRKQEEGGCSRNGE